ncbi:MAG TPA: TatA/E family twin arginine-targeting protein translocase [Dehalococcoidales bacterium]|nr:TatA/E family twin arginine-targeting protein translocase [Dehalococcoidales bacterium]
MDFFGIGLGEVLLILIVALIIWGPKRLPEIARTLGKTVRTLKKATSDLTSQVTRELDIEETERKERDKLAPPGESRMPGKDATKNE